MPDAEEIQVDLLGKLSAVRTGFHYHQVKVAVRPHLSTTGRTEKNDLFGVGHFDYAADDFGKLLSPAILRLRARPLLPFTASTAGFQTAGRRVTFFLAASSAMLSLDSFDLGRRLSLPRTM